MAQQTGYTKPEHCESYFIQASIPTDSVKIDTATFTDKKLTRESLQMLDWFMLKELRITSIEALCILKQAKKAISQTNYAETPAAKLP